MSFYSQKQLLERIASNTGTVKIGGGGTMYFEPDDDTDDSYAYAYEWEGPRMSRGHNHNSYGYSSYVDYNKIPPLTVEQIAAKLEREPKGFLAVKKWGWKLLVIKLISVREVVAVVADGSWEYVKIGEVYPWDSKNISRW